MKGLRLEQATPGPSCVGVGILLASVMLLFLPSLSCDPGSASGSSYEKVIPRNLTVSGMENSVAKASYELFMQGQQQRIHLEVKGDYFVNDFPVFTYRGGILRQDRPFIPHGCHSEGYLEGLPGSFVSVNTCSGLRGILIKDEKYYSIEPAGPSGGPEHVVYPMAQPAQISCRGMSHANHGQGEPGGPNNVQAQSSLWSHTKYVEMFVVVSHQRFQMWDSDISGTVQKVMDIIALANSYTRGINTEVVLAGMEIWTQGDLIDVRADLQETLQNFNTWRREQLSHRAKHDVAHLIVGLDAGADTGRAFLSGACSSEYAAAVEAFHHEDVLLFVALMVHELGHNLGIWHDHAACVCENKHFCLMNENITKETGFSNCSSDDYHRFLQERRGSCLFNKPQGLSRWRRETSTCGNGVREEDEQCDCGDDCDTDKCCNSDCYLKGGAQCAHTECCTENCKPAPKGHLCRTDDLECDLPEYCDGVSDECPKDLYKVDGSRCEEIYTCSGGKCKSHNMQCKTLFGSSASSAPEECYLKVNSLGNRFGNCGRSTSDHTAYVKCTKENMLCGKIVCTGVSRLPKIEEYYTVSSFWHENSYCWAMDAYKDTDIPDRGDVEENTSCHANKACQGSSCSDFTPTPPCDIGQCHLHGICNNLLKCHCFSGYAPPKCADIGEGGSEDGGSPASPVNIKQNKNSTPGGAKDKGLSMAVLSALIFLLLLTLIIIISAIFFSRSREPPVVSPEETEEFSEEPEEEPEEEEAGEEEEEEEEEGEPEEEEEEA